jgi:hypothetical protein
MDYGLDLLMNPSKTIKKKYNVERKNKDIIDIIKDNVVKDLDIYNSTNIDECLLEKIINICLEINEQQQKIKVTNKLKKDILRNSEHQKKIESDKKLEKTKKKIISKKIDINQKISDKVDKKTFIVNVSKNQ